MAKAAKKSSGKTASKASKKSTGAAPKKAVTKSSGGSGLRSGFGGRYFVTDFLERFWPDAFNAEQIVHGFVGAAGDDGCGDFRADVGKVFEVAG